MKAASSQKPAEFSTRDIYLASVIKESGIPIVRVENHSGRGVFIFQANEKIQDLINKYFNSSLKMDPKGLFETWKSLKAMAFSTIGNVR
jgi:hypothetical protein